MFALFVKVISPFCIFLGLVILYAYATGQSSHDLINAIISLITSIVRTATEVFNRG